MVPLLWLEWKLIVLFIFVHGAVIVCLHASNDILILNVRLDTPETTVLVKE